MAILNSMTDDKTIIASVNTESQVTDIKSSPVLLQYDGGGAGKRFLLNQNPIIIGRKAEKSQIWIDDASVSREHCRIEIVDKDVTAMDLGSLNHTYINDRIIESTTKLVHSDMLRVGNVRLRYFAHGNADQLLVDRIYRIAVMDRMLNIFRKEYLLEKLEEEFSNSKSQESDFSLAFLDLDKFKSVNDTYGHDAGDFVLKQTCSVIRKVTPAHYLFGRYGGEELLILMPKTNIQVAHEFCELIRHSIETEVYQYQDTVIPVTISIGVSYSDKTMLSSLDLIKSADNYVYQSKRTGRNKVSSPASPSTA